MDVGRKPAQLERTECETAQPKPIAKRWNIIVDAIQQYRCDVCKCDGGY